jgi:hypothetical protein
MRDKSRAIWASGRSMSTAVIEGRRPSPSSFQPFSLVYPRKFSVARSAVCASRFGCSGGKVSARRAVSSRRAPPISISLSRSPPSALRGQHFDEWGASGHGHGESVAGVTALSPGGDGETAIFLWCSARICRRDATFFAHVIFTLWKMSFLPPY